MSAAHWSEQGCCGASRVLRPSCYLIMHSSTTGCISSTLFHSAIHSLAHTQRTHVAHARRLLSPSAHGCCQVNGIRPGSVSHLGRPHARILDHALLHAGSAEYASAAPSRPDRVLHSFHSDEVLCRILATECHQISAGMHVVLEPLRSQHCLFGSQPRSLCPSISTVYSPGRRGAAMLVQQSGVWQDLGK